MENSDMNLSTPSQLPAQSQTTSSAASWFSGIVRSRSSAPKRPNNSSASAAGDGAGVGCGPINKKHQFRGVMFKYGPKPIQINVEENELEINIVMGFALYFLVVCDYKQQVIFIGGLTDGFLATEYLEPLAIALEKEHWSLVQFLFSSSYSGYGISSLKQDATELDQLMSYLINKEDSEGVVLLGHSTGCQDIVHYLRTNAACSRAVRAAILQAPVSDREYKATLPDTASMIDLASTMISEGRGSELMPREANPDSPITAYRYHSLCAYNGDDDMFSSDFSEDQLKQRLGHMSSTPTLCGAMGGAEKAEIEYGNHSLSNRVEEAVQSIMDFIRRDGPTGWDDPWS
ncbi:hypothetical protein BUALT_Bualt12G0128700 [Buddleja alternifolia]|uniref:Uncharacterized protein n=1 Tax=Buddleja alternifolia TaxID=168488 RepID=A0AAV6WX49_9LAMI|nr:hypothetical protein BUALT_Bualt12G0128700 [Buddleja alternifolia]